MKRWTIISMYLAAAGLLFYYRGSVSSWLDHGDSWAHHFSVLFFAFVIALVPAIPYGIAAAVMGAKYGPLVGTAVNLAVSVAAAAVLFALVRYTFTPEQRRKAAGMRGVFRLTTFAEGNPFMAVLIARLLPIVPAQAINLFAGLTRMRFATYVTATILGKVPFIITVTLLGDQIFEQGKWRQIGFIVLIYAVFLLIIGFIYNRTSWRYRGIPNWPRQK